ncbi:UNVERIFIED_ORG: hypothetical protein ABID33_004028 [Xanthobacter viscosus]|jgi:hypothetical protein|uniref:Uncharacterized protein n=1 Tax=Xanthobacter autotrophicus TaxID=280 RepID=A0A6C1KL81_XANAU|nr:hypothetical protein [Xanthobacter autotrophicus]TLX44407.1 hypothetical protein FBQ73_03315 [Xanthobacter autotrophicus]
MSEETDFFRLIGAIGDKAALFSAAGNAARKAVNEIVRAQLIADGTTLDEVRQIRTLLGPAAFAEALDGVPAPKTKVLLTRADPHGPALAQPGDRIKALLALADGSRAPAAAPEKPAKKAASRKAPAGKDVAAKDEAAKDQPAIAPAPRKRKITGRAALRVSEER